MRKVVSAVRLPHLSPLTRAPRADPSRSADTLNCDRCKKYFHMECVTPPMLSKPARGYGWTCAPCSRAHEEEVEGHDVRHHTPAAPKPPKSNAPAARGRGRPRKDRVLAEKEENVEIKHFKMWPFRYFGRVAPLPHSRAFPAPAR